MCGITGYFETVPRSMGEELEATAVTMAATLHHRGPDDSGVWTDPIAGIVLAHRRLSIMDLSPLGRQPMHSPCDRYVVTFNGEIYNFRALRQELEARGQQFRGQSDTEVLVACVTEFGIMSAVRRLNGMFAFALWIGENDSSTWCAIGSEKNRSTTVTGQNAAVGSELKALRTHPEFACRLNRDALALYLSITTFRRRFLSAKVFQRCCLALWYGFRVRTPIEFRLSRSTGLSMRPRKRRNPYIWIWSHT